MKFVLIAMLVLAGTGMSYAGCPDGFTLNTAMKKRGVPGTYFRG